MLYKASCQKNMKSKEEVKNSMLFVYIVAVVWEL